MDHTLSEFLPRILKLGFFISTCLIDYSNCDLVFVNQDRTWREAREICHTQYDGHLVTLEEEFGENLKSCLPTKFSAWSGFYTMVSDWLTVKGCYQYYGTFDAQVHKLSEPSVYACVKKCSDESISSVSIKQNECICGDVSRDNFTADSARCNTTCDDLAFCGGADVYTVYQKSEKRVPDVEGHKLCATYKCTDCIISYNVELEAFNCSSRKRYICGDDDSNTYSAKEDKRNWKTAMNNCSSRHQRFLTDDTSDNCACIRPRRYWIGLFRTEGLMQDNALQPYSDDEPHRVGKITRSAENILMEPIIYSASQSSKFICQTENHTIVPHTGDIICKNKPQTEFTQTPTKVTEAWTSSWISEHSDNYVGNQDSGVTRMNLAVVVGAVTASCIVLVISVAILILLMKRKVRKSSSKNDENKHSNMTYAIESLGSGENIFQNCNSDEQRDGIASTNLPDYKDEPIYKNDLQFDESNDYFILESIDAQQTGNTQMGDNSASLNTDNSDFYSLAKLPADNSDDAQYMESTEGDYDILNRSGDRHVESPLNDDIYSHAKSHDDNTETDYDKLIPSSRKQCDSEIYDHAKNDQSNIDLDHYDTMSATNY